MRKQLGTKNSKSNEGSQEKNSGVQGRDGSVKELDRETGDEQTTVGWAPRKDGGFIYLLFIKTYLYRVSTIQ